MKALTICQPYAELILRGEKPVENRTWATRYRGPLIIHAGKSREWLGAWPDPDSLTFGAILGIAWLDDCVDMSIDDERRAKLLALNSHHVIGPFCWVMPRSIRLTKPMPYMGSQGLWNLDSTKLGGASLMLMAKQLGR